jgi:thiol:disulfide interchange protein
MRIISFISLLSCSIILFNTSCGSKKKNNATAPIIKKEKVDEEEEAAQMVFNFESYPLLGDVLDKAAKEKKLIYLDAGAKWCPPCQLLKKNVYTHLATATFFNEHFISYLVDVEKGEGPDIKLMYNISSLPTLLFLDEKGREISRIESGISASALTAKAKEVLAKTGR